MARDKNWSYNSYDEAENISVVGNYVWDTGSLAWIKQTPAGGGGSGLTNAELRATPVPVSGPLTDLQLRASAVAISGTVSISGTVPVSGPLTDTQLRATAVPVDTEMPAAIALGDLVANPTTPFIGAALMTWDGFVWSRLLNNGFGIRVNLDNSSLNPVAASQTPGGGAPDAWSQRLTNSGRSAFLTTTGDRLHVDGSGVTQPISVDGEGSIATAQVSVTTTAGTVVAARAGRRSLLIVNHGTTPVFLGPATVTVANGILLPGVVGASISIPTTALVQGIVVSGTQTVSYIEVF